MVEPQEIKSLFNRITGVKNIYVQPPEDIKLKYPCIIVELSRINTTHANNKPYLKSTPYSVTYISSDIIESYNMIKALSDLPLCRFDRSFNSNNLYHYVFEIYL